jgi:hypothetical protein
MMRGSAGPGLEGGCIIALNLRSGAGVGRGLEVDTEAKRTGRLAGKRRLASAAEPAERSWMVRCRAAADSDGERPRTQACCEAVADCGAILAGCPAAKAAKAA